MGLTTGIHPGVYGKPPGRNNEPLPTLAGVSWRMGEGHPLHALIAHVVSFMPPERGVIRSNQKRQRKISRN